MQKGNSVIGKDVLSLAEGTRIHSVKDLVIGEASDQVVALLVDEGGLLSSSTVVPLEAVHSFGRDAVVIQDRTAVLAASNVPEVRAILDRRDSLRGKRVYTESGRNLGTIGDLYFEESTGRILGYEVSSGGLADVASGKSWIDAEQVQRAGPDVLFVSDSTEQAVEGQVGGLRGTLSEVKDKAGQATSQAREGISTGVDGLRSQGGESSPEIDLVGRRSGADVMDENGGIVVASGQPITLQAVQRASETGNLQLLYDAADAGATQEREQKTTETTQKVTDTAGDLWDRFTTKLRETQDEHGQQADEQQTRLRLAQIADAIGRPVTKVILDRSDSVILDLGDIITHQSVQQAHDSGMLDTLLASVYRGEVLFTRDEMRAEQPAAATVEKASGGATILEELESKVQTAEEERQQKQEQARAEQEQAREQRQQEREERAQQREQTAQQREEAERVKEEARLAMGPGPGADGSQQQIEQEQEPEPEPQPATAGDRSTTTFTA